MNEAVIDLFISSMQFIFSFIWKVTLSIWNMFQQGDFVELL